MANTNQQNASREDRIEADRIEMEAVNKSVLAGLGVTEWESFLTLKQTRELIELAERGAGTWAKEPAALEQARLASVEVNEITEADIEAVEDEIGMGRGAWDMVDHRELIVACVKVVCGKSA